MKIKNNLIKAKAEYYGYKQLSKYIRDSAIYEKVTNVDLIGKNEILKEYSDNIQILKQMYKSIRQIIVKFKVSRNVDLLLFQKFDYKEKLW